MIRPYPRDPLFAAIQMRCPATPQSSHWYQLELQAKKKAAYGPKCDQCVYLIMLSFASWVPETTFICVNVFINCSYSSCWVVAHVLYHIGFRRKYWMLSGYRKELRFQYKGIASGHGDITTVKVKFLSYTLNWAHIAFFILQVSLIVFLSLLLSVFCLSSKGWNALNKSILMPLERSLAGLQ